MDENAIIPYMYYLKLTNQGFGKCDHAGAVGSDHTLKELWAGNFPESNNGRRQSIQGSNAMRLRWDEGAGYLITSQWLVINGMTLQSILQGKQKFEKYLH